MKNKGFTLIELMIVMVIIAILAGMSIFGLLGAREAGRDGKRKADLESIRSALEIYRADCGEYPASVVSGSALTGSCPSTNTYMEKVPTDPDGTSNYDYCDVGSPPQRYCLCTDLEQDPAGTPPCNCGTGNDYCVQNP